MRVTLPEEAARLDAIATRVETPCGSGTMVWRTWGSGPPLVLLHGGSGSWAHWLYNIPALVAAGRQLWVPDLPGFGESAQPPGSEDADAVVPVLRAGLDALVPGRFDLVGFSFGSLVATLTAARLPQRLDKLVLVGAPVLPLRNGKGVEMRPWRDLSSAAEREAAHAHNLRALMLHRAESITPAAIAIQAANVPRDRMRGRRLVTTPLLSETLAGLAGPAWMVYGNQDALYREDWAPVVARVQTLPCVRDLAFVPDAGHWLQFEQPEAFNRYLLGVLETR
jgi:pimeloyl-ACP methyl ester carboxylesterase